MDVLEQRDVGKVISPAALKDCVGKTYSRFSDNNQQVLSLPRIIYDLRN
jgi:hypothetical protein